MAKPNKDLNPQLQQSKPPQVDEVAKQKQRAETGVRKLHPLEVKRH